MRAFAELGGLPRQILYDRMKTAVLSEEEARHVIYHPRLLELTERYGFRPRACAPYRAKTKGKVERPTATSEMTSSWAVALPTSRI